MVSRHNCGKALQSVAWEVLSQPLMINVSCPALLRPECSIDATLSAMLRTIITVYGTGITAG